MSEVKLTGEYHADINLLTSELAALREELAEYQKILASYKNNYVTSWRITQCNQA